LSRKRKELKTSTGPQSSLISGLTPFQNGTGDEH
jgi:hypothetical protein